MYKYCKFSLFPFLVTLLTYQYSILKITYVKCTRLSRDKVTVAEECNQRESD